MTITLSGIISGAAQYDTEGRTGLAHMARFKWAVDNGEAVPDETMQFLSNAFTAILDVTYGNSAEIRKTVADELAVHGPKKGRRDLQKLPLKEIRKTQSYRVAEYVKNLEDIEGASKPEAVKKACREFAQDERQIYKACKLHKRNVLSSSENLELIAREAKQRYES